MPTSREGAAGRDGRGDRPHRRLVHQQDIRRPLGRPRAIPADRLVPALRTTLSAPCSGACCGSGTSGVATDLDWAFGRGPEVRGTAEALLMARLDELRSPAS